MPSAEDLRRPLLPAKRQRTTPSRLVPTAADRLPAAWTVQMQPGGRRRATCLACQHQIEEHEPRMARISEISSGGRWYHPCCVPGGLRPDDTLSISGPGDPEMAHMVEIQQDRLRRMAAADQASAANTAPPAAATQLDTLDTGEPGYGTPQAATPLQIDPTIMAMLAEPESDRSLSGDTEAPDPSSLPLEPCVPEEDILTDTMWMRALQCRAPVLSSLTPNFYNIYSDVKVGLIKDALLAREDADDYLEKWWRLLLVDKLLFHKGGDPSLALNAKLRARFQAVRDGDWYDLVTELTESSPPQGQTKHPSDSDIAKRIQAFAAMGSWSRAIAAARADAPPDRSPQAWTKLRAELPTVNALCSPTNHPLQLSQAQTTDLRGNLLTKIRKADLAASPGLLGSTPHLWKLLTREDEEETTEIVLDLLVRIACADVSPQVRSLLIHADLIAGPRSDTRVRPIEVPSFLRKTAMSALMEVLADEAQAAAGPEQVGLRTPDGTSVAFATIDHEIRRNPSHVVACVDISGAHSSTRRDSLELICQEDAPTLGEVLKSWYHTPSPKTWRGASARELSTSSGLGQGPQRRPPCSASASVALPESSNKTTPASDW